MSTMDIVLCLAMLLGNFTISELIQLSQRNMLKKALKEKGYKLGDCLSILRTRQREYIDRHSQLLCITPYGIIGRLMPVVNLWSSLLNRCDFKSNKDRIVEELIEKKLVCKFSEDEEKKNNFKDGKKVLSKSRNKNEDFILKMDVELPSDEALIEENYSIAESFSDIPPAVTRIEVTSFDKESNICLTARDNTGNIVTIIIDRNHPNLGYITKYINKGEYEIKGISIQDLNRLFYELEDTKENIYLRQLMHQKAVTM